MSRKKDKQREAKKRAELEQMYEEMYSPEEKAAHKAFWDEWFDSVMPPEWKNDPPSADIIDINTRKKPV